MQCCCCYCAVETQGTGDKQGFEKAAPLRQPGIAHTQTTDKDAESGPGKE